MSEGTYEFECMRSELLGIDPPNQDEFEKLREERLKAEQAEQEAAEAALLAEQDVSLQNTGGKLDELNSILTSTQSKLNRFKQSACGSLSRMLSRGSIDDPNIATNAGGSSASSSRRNTTADDGEQNTSANSTETVDNSDETQERQQLEGEEIKPQIPYLRNASLDIQKKMTSHLDKLDMLINKADRAECAMSSQTKQMKKITK